MIRSTRTTVTAELAEWCRNYHFNNPWPADFSKRFAIGLYQIWGGLEWMDCSNTSEALCGGALHFLMVQEALELNWCEHLPRDFHNLISIGSYHRDYRGMIVRVSRAQQHILYASQSKGLKGTVKTGRSSRYNPKILNDDLCWIIKSLFSWVSTEMRPQGIEDASHNMTVRI